MEDVEDAKARLARFARLETAPHGAPLYSRLAAMASQDDALAGLLAEAPPAQRRGTLFFAAFRYLQITAGEHWDEVALAPDPEAAFRSRCLKRAAEMRHLMATRNTQTNEVGRSALLMPALADVARRTGAPLALIEPGASAGLNLNLDRFGYDYGPAGKLEGTDGVKIRTEVRGDVFPPVPDAPPEVEWRMGIDVAPVDVTDDDAIAWLRACVWAEHPARETLLSRAVEVAKEHPVKVLRADAIEALPPAISRAPASATVCVFHSTFLPYLDGDQRFALTQVLLEASRDREIFRISLEGWTAAKAMGIAVPERGDDGGVAMLLTSARLSDGSISEARALAFGSPHGLWTRWLEQPAA